MDDQLVKTQIMKMLNGSIWTLHKHMKVSDFQFPIIKGDMLRLVLKPDVQTTITTVQKVTDIEPDGTIRIECVNLSCIKVDCTYLDLYECEIKNVKVDNTHTKSQKLQTIIL